MRSFSREGRFFKKKNENFDKKNSAPQANFSKKSRQKKAFLDTFSKDLTKKFDQKWCRKVIPKGWTLWKNLATRNEKETVAHPRHFPPFGTLLEITHHIHLSVLLFRDFRYESNGIFVLGVGFFFLQTNFDFLTSHFWRNFLYHSKAMVVLSLNLKRYFTCDNFS